MGFIYILKKQSLFSAIIIWLGAPLVTQEEEEGRGTGKQNQREGSGPCTNMEVCVEF